MKSERRRSKKKEREIRTTSLEPLSCVGGKGYDREPVDKEWCSCGGGKKRHKKTSGLEKKRRKKGDMKSVDSARNEQWELRRNGGSRVADVRQKKAHGWGVSSPSTTAGGKEKAPGRETGEFIKSLEERTQQN